MWLYLPTHIPKPRQGFCLWSKARQGKEKIAFSCLEKWPLFCGSMDSTALSNKSGPFFLGMSHSSGIITHVGHPKKISSVFGWCFGFMNMLPSTREGFLCFALRVHFLQGTYLPIVLCTLHMKVDAQFP
jgi:hypothetical protein